MLTTMLAVDERDRQLKNPRLYRASIHRLWPEVLREPVNQPHEGPWRPFFRFARWTGANRLLTPGLKREIRKVLGAE